jgi:hypothetical protein
MHHHLILNISLRHKEEQQRFLLSLTTVIKPLLKKSVRKIIKELLSNPWRSCFEKSRKQHFNNGHEFFYPYISNPTTHYLLEYISPKSWSNDVKLLTTTQISLLQRLFGAISSSSTTAVVGHAANLY